MKKLLGLVFNRWVLVAVLLLALAFLIWIVGPLVAIAEARPLEPEGARWITIGVIVLFAVAVMAWKAWRAKRGNTQVVNQLLAAPAGDKKVAESPDMIAIRQRFEGALETLRKARFGSQGVAAGWAAKFNGRFMYELPWYLIIGAPGSGKTTALRHSGLKFPLAEAAGGAAADLAVRGVGGTRHCDWWFTDRAVLIDTAGRFTTQDSDRQNDRATWSGFLGMLKKARPRQPVNGVLVTVSMTDLLTRSAIERAQHAGTVRQRVQELHQDLGIQFPIYLMVTKCDLLAGFMDYFGTLDKDRRAAPWGFTFKFDPKQPAQDLSKFDAEFDLLQQRLTDGLVDRLQAEADPQRRARVYGFPGQFASLRTALHEFVDAVFSPSPYEANPMLRGVYFISGTQEGTPIDRMLGSIARSYKLERAILPPLQASGRSYFLTRLLDEVVFAESGLAGTNIQWEKRRGMLALGGYAVASLVAIGLISAWSISYFKNRGYVAEVAARVDAVRGKVQATPNRASADLLPLLPALEATRQLATTGSDDSVPWTLGFGLFQGRKLDSAARLAYERMLVDAMLPRLAIRVEEQLRVGGDAQETQYEALKTYLTMYDPQRFDAEALKAYVESDWDARLASELSPEQREAMGRHLDALLAQGPVVSPQPIDQALVDATRTRIASVDLTQRIYNRLRSRGLGKTFPEFTIANAGGSNAPLVFVRTSGKPLTSGVPGLFTRDGYHKGFQENVGAVSRQLADEQSWVLNINTPAGGAANLLTDKVADDVRRLHLNEYVAVWKTFIADIRLQPMTSVSQSVQISRLLSSPDSPMVKLFTAISRETTLVGTGLGGKVESKVQGAINAGKKALEEKIGVKPVTDPNGGEPVEMTVDREFRDLRNLVTAPEGGKAPIENTVALIGEAYVMLNAADTALKGGGAPPPSPVPAKLKAEAPLLPEPAKSVVETLAQASGKVTTVQLREILGRDVKSQVGEFCQQAIAGRYPMDRNATRDATQADFALLFAPGGKIESLFTQKLAPYVDTSTRPWKFRQVDGTALGGDSGTLPQFQRAAAIKETFFPTGNTPSLRLEFKPVEMDPGLTQFVLDVDGQIVRYAHGPQIPMSVQWPGPRGSSEVRVQISPPGASGSSGLVTGGPWALFRMFDRTRIEPGNSPERFRATFTVDGRKAVFDVSASSVRNPFILRELAEFSCPNGL